MKYEIYEIHASRNSSSLKVSYKGLLISPTDNLISWGKKKISIFVQFYKRDYYFIYNTPSSHVWRYEVHRWSHYPELEYLNWKSALNFKLGLIHVQETDPYFSNSILLTNTASDDCGGIWKIFCTLLHLKTAVTLQFGSMTVFSTTVEPNKLCWT